MAKLDALFEGSMKKQRKLLDLSKVKILGFEDYEKYMDKVPEIPMTLDKVNLEELQATANDYTFGISRKDRFELDISCPNFPYEDALPLSMRAVRMADLFSVDIHWKMLTDLRPSSKIEEELFNRIVQLGKLKRDTKIQEAKLLAASLSNIAHCSAAQGKAISLGIVTSKSKRGTMETRMKTCRECGLELCTGAFCKVHHYDSYARVILDPDELEAEDAGFSLKNVIAQANTKVDEKSAAKAVKARRAKNRGPSLKAMLVKANKKGRKKKKNKHEDAPTD